MQYFYNNNNISCRHRDLHVYVCIIRNVCMCVCMYMYLSLSLSLYIYIYIYICIHVMQRNAMQLPSADALQDFMKQATFCETICV